MELGMRIYTVTKADQPVAVVRASNRIDAIDTALALNAEVRLSDALDVRDPSDAEMVGWLERREDYVVESAGAA
jgi:SpoVK/Ycf46/Vps4 family AAA+-type ATPase